VQGVVDYMLKFAPGVSPHYYERSRRSGLPLGDRFESRLRDLIPSLGEPAVEPYPAWYPNADMVAGWRRGDKTLTLVLERDDRSGAAVLLWCVSDGELATLLGASRTRLDRVIAADFDRHFDREVAHLVEPGRHRPLTFKTLVDDLAVIPDRSGTLLAGKLRDADGEVRCVAADLVLELGGGLPAVRPLLEDPVDWVRWHVIGLMARYGDDSAVEPLIATLQSDPEPGVRAQAAYALGQIGSLAAIPQLLDALDHDRECDSQGHSPSSVSATALDNILGTNQTRIKHDGGFCSLAPWPPDYEALKSQARELHRKWKADLNVT
jgi:HEAT repeat protein